MSAVFCDGVREWVSTCVLAPDGRRGPRGGAGGGGNANTGGEWASAAGDVCVILGVGGSEREGMGTGEAQIEFEIT